MTRERTARGFCDGRWRAVVLTATLVGAGGSLLAALSDRELLISLLSNVNSAGEAPGAARVREETEQRFQQGVLMLHAKQYRHAVTAFHRVLELEPALPEAHVNMGFALIGLERYSLARDFFGSAIELRKNQVNAYYGLAVALDGLNDRLGAIGAMRTYVHLSKPDDPHSRKARAALWEWEAESGTAGPAGNGRW